MCRQTFKHLLLIITPDSVTGLQHVPGDSGGLHRAAQGRPVGLALRPAHTAAEEDGRRPAGLCPGQSPEGSGCHEVKTETFSSLKKSPVCFYPAAN